MPVKDDDRVEIVNVPDASAAPDEGTLPARFGKIVNHAEDEELGDAFRSWARTNITRFEGQDARVEFMKDTGTMDIADRMFRVAMNRDTTNDQTKDTLSNVTSPMFHVQVRSISAGEMAILFGDDRLPAIYEPEINTTEYTSDDGELIARQQNMLEEYTFDEDKRRDKIREIDLFHNKYGLQCVSVEWVREEREVTQNEPDKAAGMLENGRWAAFKRSTRKRVVKDWPVLMRHPIEHCYFDSCIPDLNDQICFAVKQRRSLENLYALQEQGYIKNVDQLTNTHLYQGETQTEKPVEDRQRNAGESALTEATGEVEVWQVWGRVPISEKTTPKTKRTTARWDSSKNPPSLWWAWYAGDIRSGSAVCLKMVKNPNWHGKIPYRLIRSHRDDKGAFNMGYASMIQSLYWQAVTNINQACDNVTERNWSPMVANGPVYKRNLTFRKNDLIKIDRVTTKFERLDIPDTTQITMGMHDIIENMANQLTGADKPIRAEALGSRTSATEAKNVFDQATQPLDEKASYFADQLFPWLLEIDAHLWRQYGDPTTINVMTHTDIIEGVNPAELWGPVRTKVTAVTRFRNNTIRRQELNSFLQGAAPIFVNVMGDEGLRTLGREMFHTFGLDKAEEIFPISADYDARSRAIQENSLILQQGDYSAPEKAENHRAHNAVHEPALEAFSLLSDTPPENVANMRIHIQQHKDFVAQTQRDIAAMQSTGETPPGQQAAAPAAPGLEGNVTGNRIEAEEGAIA